MNSQMKKIEIIKSEMAASLAPSFTPPAEGMTSAFRLKLIEANQGDLCLPVTPGAASSS